MDTLKAAHEPVAPEGNPCLSPAWFPWRPVVPGSRISRNPSVSVLGWGANHLLCAHESSPLKCQQGLPKTGRQFLLWWPADRTPGLSSHTCKVSLGTTTPNCAGSEGAWMVNAPCPPHAWPLGMLRARRPAQPLREPSGRGFCLSSACPSVPWKHFTVDELRPVGWPGHLPAQGPVSKPSSSVLNFSCGPG